MADAAAGGSLDEDVRGVDVRDEGRPAAGVALEAGVALDAAAPVGGLDRGSGGEWPRPVPLIGDRTSAAERAAGPRDWAMPVEVRDGLRQVIAARRDIRRYRPDPVPSEVLQRVLEAAHAAPSVGHSQPWRFVVVRDPAIRDAAAVLTDRERLRQAAQLEPDAARRLLDLQLEGVREAPLGIVVLCDRRVPAAGVLGRATFPDADLWSCAAAIQNLWLAARAEGLGVGWVTLFRPEDLAALLGLPDGVVTLGWLCLGWPDERPPEPGLQRAGWSRRLPLADVVLTDRWPGTGGPSAGRSDGQEQGGPTVGRDERDRPSPDGQERDRVTPDGNQRDRLSRGGERSDGDQPGGWQPRPPVSWLRAPGPGQVVGARDEADALLTAPGSLGVLDRAVDRVVALGRADCTGGTLVLAAADHPVTAHGVSAYHSRVTADVARAAVADAALGARAARAAGLDVRVVDAGVGRPVPGALDARPRDPRGDLVAAAALSAPDVSRLVERGRRLGAELAGAELAGAGLAGAGLAGAGLVALGEIGVGNSTVAAALAGLLLDLDADAVVGLGAGADSAMLDRKRAVVSAALRRARAEGHGPQDPLGALAAVGGPELAFLSGVTLGAAAGRAPVVLDGLAVSVCALVAVQLEPAVQPCLIAGQRSREVAHPQVLEALGLEPLLDLRIRAGEGAGAALAAGLLLDGLRLRRETARTSSGPR